MRVIVDHDGRGEAAATQTPNRLQRKFPVFGDTTYLEAQILLQSFEDLFAALDITGGSHADADDMFSSGKGGEKRIKGNDAENLRRREVEALGDPPLDLAWKVPVDILAFLQNGDQGPVSSLVFVDNTIDLVEFFPGQGVDEPAHFRTSGQYSGVTLFSVCRKARALFLASWLQGMEKDGLDSC
jgi:hypothetical protein